MLYFREKEKQKILNFSNAQQTKAMAVYGRRRTGKTALMLDCIRNGEPSAYIYYQCTSHDYQSCLSDFIETLSSQLDHADILTSLHSFRDAFRYLSDVERFHGRIIIIDEFPFLAKKNENVPVEFQWIIDHGLNGLKLILLGSNLSFMKSQINGSESPLYGRFDEILEVRPFSFQEVQSLFPVFEDAVSVYAQTGGVAQYVMLFKNYPDVESASDALFFDRDGRLFQEAANLLMQDLREITTYVSILRAIGESQKDSSKIAERCGIDQRNVFSYLKKLIDLEIVAEVRNPLVEKKTGRRYRISDTFFRFYYTFIEPNISMITSVGSNARNYILNEHYREFLGIVYEDIIRNNCFRYALSGTIPFMPKTVGQWWGRIQLDGQWRESEIDLVAYDEHSILLGECKYREKAIGMKELELLRYKANFIPTKGREIYFLLASRNGFTQELETLGDPNTILLNQA